MLLITINCKYQSTLDLLRCKDFPKLDWRGCPGQELTITKRFKMKDESELFGVRKLSTHCFPGHIVPGEVRPEKAGQEDNPWSHGEHAQPLTVHTGAKPRWQTWWKCQTHLGALCQTWWAYWKYQTHPGTWSSYPNRASRKVRRTSTYRIALNIWSIKACYVYSVQIS